jgi:hypothetical protein
MAVTPELQMAKKLIPVIENVLKGQVGKVKSPDSGVVISQALSSIQNYNKGGNLGGVTTGGKGESDYLSFKVGDNNPTSFKVYPATGDVEIFSGKSSYKIAKVLVDQ